MRGWRGSDQALESAFCIISLDDGRGWDLRPVEGEQNRGSSERANILRSVDRLDDGLNLHTLTE